MPKDKRAPRREVDHVLCDDLDNIDNGGENGQCRRKPKKTQVCQIFTFSYLDMLNHQIDSNLIESLSRNWV